MPYNTIHQVCRFAPVANPDDVSFERTSFSFGDVGAQDPLASEWDSIYESTDSESFSRIKR